MNCINFTNDKDGLASVFFYSVNNNFTNYYKQKIM